MTLASVQVHIHGSLLSHSVFSSPFSQDADVFSHADNICAFEQCVFMVWLFRSMPHAINAVCMVVFSYNIVLHNL